MAESLPDALAALVAELRRAGFGVSDDESCGWAFRQVTLLNPERSYGNVVRLIQDRGLWGVEVAVEGDAFHDPHEVLLALDAREFESRAMSHDERRAATLEVLDRLPHSAAEVQALRARLREYREDYRRWMSGRDHDLDEARRNFDAGDFRSAVESYERLRDGELSRADRIRLRIARERTTAS
jgi:hypothetical protein